MQTVCCSWQYMEINPHCINRKKISLFLTNVLVMSVLTCLFVLYTLRAIVLRTSQYDPGFAEKLLLKDQAVPTVLEPASTLQTLSNFIFKSVMIVKFVMNYPSIFTLLS